MGLELLGYQVKVPHGHILGFVVVTSIDDSHWVKCDPRPKEHLVTTSSTEGIKTVLHPVSDLERAKVVFTALLGQPPQTDGPYYVGFDVAGQHIGLLPGGGPQHLTSPVAYWQVRDMEAKLAELTAAGASVKDPASDVGGGRRVATVTDPDGNVLGLTQDN
jgi:predicted enzyme related to lactoylglutathione lyase